MDIPGSGAPDAPDIPETPETSPTSGTAAEPYVSRTPEDVLAAVPLVLGFEPAESVVMLTFGGPRTFHARVDLPRDRADLPELVEALRGPAVRHGVVRVLLVGYDRDGRWTGEVLRAVAAGMERVGIEVVACLRADRGRWWPVGPVPSPSERGPGTAYDAAGHRFRTRSVVEGRVTLPDRAALAAGLASAPGGPDPAVRSALARARVPSVRRVDALLADLLDTGERPDADQLATLLLVAEEGRLRERVQRRLTRATAPRLVDLWSEVVRRAPEERVADAAALLGLCAWVSGHGALAWCAVDRAREVEPPHGLAGMVATLLEAAVPPQEWEALLRPLAG